MTIFKKGWSAWPEQMVNITGTGGQDGSDYTAGTKADKVHG